MDMGKESMNSNQSKQKAAVLRLKVVQGLALAGSLSLLGSGVAQAQLDPAAASLELEATVPAASSPELPPLEVPAAEVSPAEFAPEPEAIATPDFASSTTSVESSAPVSVELQGQFIDPTPYEIGATEPYDPIDVVVSERSSGCEASIDTLNAVGDVCGSSYYSESNESGPSAGYSNPDSISVGGLFGDGSQSLSAKNFLNLTTRPIFRFTNGDRSLLFPLPMPVALTSVFGLRHHPIFHTVRFHTGVDYAAEQGTPVLATFSGRVEIADFLGGYGLTVVLDHSKKDAQTLYGHLSEIFVQPGEWVEQGTVIGRVGSTGNSTGPHLHFELRKWDEVNGWIAVDPLTQLQFAMAELVTRLKLANLAEAEGNS